MIEYYNEDCMEGMKRYGDKHFDLNYRKNRFNILDVCKITLPNTNNTKSELFHVSVLRNIQGHSFSLALVWIGIHRWISVPIIPIKLNNNIFAWYKSIYSKLFVNNILRDKFNFQIRQKFVGCYFKSIREIFALPCIHLNKMFLKGIAFVSARNRTVFLAIERWRSHKILTANLTNKMHLVSGLIFISAINTAGYSLLCSAQRNIKSFSAINTNKVNTVFFMVWPFVLMVTLRRAIFNIFSARLPDKFSTTSAIKFTYSVFHYNTPATIFSVFTITQRPIAVNRWLDTHVGSASSLIACYDMGFDAVGFELDKDYYEASKKRLNDFMAQGRLFE